MLDLCALYEKKKAQEDIFTFLQPPTPLFCFIFTATYVDYHPLPHDTMAPVSVSRAMLTANGVQLLPATI
jgi:hypothetical protein